VTGRGASSASGRRTEAGSALVEVSWLSVLLLVPLLYVVLAVFEVQRSAFAVTGAARAAGRAYVVAPSEASATARARAAAAVALNDQDLDLARGTLAVSCEPDPRNCLSPGSVVRVDVSYPVALPLMPSALGGNTPSIRVEATQRLPYGEFREDRP
jgi:Flp pilus assembly protein TadG